MSLQIVVSLVFLLRMLPRAVATYVMNVTNRKVVRTQALRLIGPKVVVIRAQPRLTWGKWYALCCRFSPRGGI